MRERLKTALAFDPRDLFLLCGFLLTVYGLSLVRPWIGLTVAGVLLMAGALALGRVR